MNAPRILSILTTLILLTLILSGCSEREAGAAAPAITPASSTAALATSLPPTAATPTLAPSSPQPTEPPPTATLPPAATATATAGVEPVSQVETATPTADESPSRPTLAPQAEGVPTVKGPITPANIDDLRKLARLDLDDMLNDLAWSPDGSLLAAATGSGVRVFETGHLGEVLTIALSEYNFALDFSPDGTSLAFSRGSAIEIVHLPDGRPIRRLEGHTDVVTDLAFSPDGKFLASGGNDGRLRVWRMADGAQAGSATSPSEFETLVAYSPKGGLIASTVTLGDYAGDGDIRLWKAPGAQADKVMEANVWGIAALDFAPNANLVIGSAGNYLLVFRVKDGMQARCYDTDQESISTLDYSPDGELIVAGSYDRKVGFYTADDVVRTLTGFTDALDTVAFSPDGRYLTTGAMDGIILLWGAPK